MVKFSKHALSNYSSFLFMI